MRPADTVIAGPEQPCRSGHPHPFRSILGDDRAERARSIVLACLFAAAPACGGDGPAPSAGHKGGTAGSDASISDATPNGGEIPQPPAAAESDLDCDESEIICTNPDEGSTCQCRNAAEVGEVEARMDVWVFGPRPEYELPLIDPTEATVMLIEYEGSYCEEFDETNPPPTPIPAVTVELPAQSDTHTVVSFHGLNPDRSYTVLLVGRAEDLAVGRGCVEDVMPTAKMGEEDRPPGVAAELERTLAAMPRPQEPG